MEIHPRIDIKNPVVNSSRIILGSFPTWSLTDPDPERKETFEQKKSERLNNGDFLYFYGSSKNRFWQWYKNHVDENIDSNEKDSIERSLEQKAIGITDVIYSCSRKNKSALDKHLTKRTYNHNFFNLPNDNERIKILCTSKGVMNEMLLNNKFFKQYAQLKVDETKSQLFQKELITSIGGSPELIKKPICTVVQSVNGGTIECVSTPSPGSPYRRLVDFGFSSGNADKFLNDYLKLAFDWLQS